MPGSKTDTVREVVYYIWENQKDIESEKDNYLSQIADDLELHRKTIARAVDFLEDLKLAKTWKDGNKRMVRLTWNPERGAEEEKG